MPIVSSIVEPVVEQVAIPVTGSDGGATPPGTMDFSKTADSGLIVLLEDI